MYAEKLRFQFMYTAQTAKIADVSSLEEQVYTCTHAPLVLADDVQAPWQLRCGVACNVEDESVDAQGQQVESVNGPHTVYLVTRGVCMLVLKFDRACSTCGIILTPVPRGCVCCRPPRHSGCPPLPGCPECGLHPQQLAVPAAAPELTAHAPAAPPAAADHTPAEVLGAGSAAVVD